MAVQVKVCGITCAADAEVAVDAGADALGFNFYPDSPRHVSPEAASAIVSALPCGVCAVGVFVNEQRADVARVLERTGIQALQFHGDESPEFCREWPGKVIKAIRVRDRTWLERARDYTVDWILADTFVEGVRGGTGKMLDTTLLEGFDRRRLIVAGGLRPENVAAVVKAVRPFGVDVASGVEASPGRKDRTLLRRFVSNAKAA